MHPKPMRFKVWLSVCVIASEIFCLCLTEIMRIDLMTLMVTDGLV